ncbi:hypothetical protein GGF32_002102 [Allomyces javanicus]|nr:hypothetical protein GGF32_002102 [Allomyces javanicus]
MATLQNPGTARPTSAKAGLTIVDPRKITGKHAKAARSGHRKSSAHKASTTQQHQPHPQQQATGKTADQAATATATKPRICRGRVGNLESNVPQAWWKHVFADEFYLKTDGDVVEDPDVTRSEVDMLESYPYVAAILRRGSEAGPSAATTNDKSTPAAPVRVLDLCCGQGRHLLELARRYPRLHLHGHDQSQYLIELARDRSAAMGVANRCTFTVGDCRTIPAAPDTYDLVLIMGNSFGYFSSTASDLQVLREAHRVSRLGAYLVVDLADGRYMKQNYSPRSWEWIDDDTFVCRERQLAKDGKALVSREVVTDVNKGVIRDQFYAERLYERDEMEMLLEMALYTPAREKHERTTPPSARSSAAPTPVLPLHTISIGGNAVGGLAAASVGGGSAAGASPPTAPEIMTAAKDLSKRQEDLGMMGQRLLVLGVKDRATDPDYPAWVSPPVQHVQLPQPASAAVSVPTSQLASLDLNESSTEENESTSTLGSSASTSDHEDDLTAPDSGVYLHDRLAPSQAMALHLQLHLTTGAFPSPVPPPEIPHLIVLMGDPSLACIGKLNDTWNAEDLATREKLYDVLRPLWNETKGQLRIFERHSKLLAELGTVAAHPHLRDNVFVFNLCDEGFRNDALQELHVPALLELLQLPYSGAGPLSLGFCYDKGLVNSTARALGVPTPRESYYLGNSLAAHVPPTELGAAALDRHVRADGVTYPAFVKPMRGDNSLGITVRSLVHDAAELHAYVCDLYHQHLGDVIVQEYLSGPEFSVGVIGNPDSGLHFLPVLQVDYSAIEQRHLVPILGFESKWDPTSPYWNDIQFLRAKLPDSVLRLVFARCAVLFERLGCRDYARFDFRADAPLPTWCTATRAAAGGAADGDQPVEKYLNAAEAEALAGRIKLLEVNPNPGWCWDGKLAHMARIEGKSYADLVMMILHVGWDRVRRQAPPAAPFVDEIDA